MHVEMSAIVALRNLCHQHVYFNLRVTYFLLRLFFLSLKLSNNGNDEPATLLQLIYNLIIIKRCKNDTLLKVNLNFTKLSFI